MSKLIVVLIFAFFAMSVFHETESRRQRNPQTKRPPPDRTAAFDGVPQPSATTVFGLTSQVTDAVTQELEETGEHIETPDGEFLVRVDHKVRNLAIWGSSGVMAVPNPTRMGLRAPSQASNGCSNRPNNLVATKYSQGLVFKMLPMEKYSIEKCQEELGELIEGNDVTNTTKRYIHDKKEKNDESDVVYVDLIEFAGTKNDENHSRFIYFCLFDTASQNVMRYWNGIQHAIVGGNKKIGQYVYRGDRSNRRRRPKLPAKELGNNQCQYISEDGIVEVYDMENDRRPLIPLRDEPAKFHCTRGSRDSVNDGYGPLADAFYHGVQVIKMLHDPAWGNIPRTQSLTKSGKMRMAVHHRHNYDNAYWDGNHLYFGDGSRNVFYPLTTCVDIIGHEFGHAISQMKSKLMYSGEPGCLNEGFSDVLGEMSELYVHKENNFKIASRCTKHSPHLRDMTQRKQYQDYFPHANPRVCREGDSVCQDPHHCSGIPNYIFYKMATAPGWDVQKAGKAWVSANYLYWKPDTSLYEAGCDVGEVVEKLKINGGDTQAVINAWKEGGIDISDCVDRHNGHCNGEFPNQGTTLAPEPSTTPNPDCPSYLQWYCGSTTTRQTTTRKTTTTTIPTTTTKRPGRGYKVLQNCQQMSGLSATKGRSLKFRVMVPRGATYQNVQIFALNGDADVYIRKGRRPTLRTKDWCPFWEGSDEWVTERLAPADTGKYYYIMIHAAESFENLDFYACYY